MGSATPAPSHLYNIRDPEQGDVEYLNVTYKDEYHSLTAQLLYLSKRGRPDLQTSISYHCTRVRKPDEDDDKKLGRTVRYLEKTKHLPLVLSVNDDGIIEWWVDASFTVHNDTKSRTGMNMSMGEGNLYAASTKQKINTLSSTHVELVGV